MSGVNWYSTKVLIEHATGFSMDALHVIVGVVVQLAFALIFRVPVSRPHAWLLVLGIELANEWNDLHVEVWPTRGIQYAESAKDIALTMLVPTLILLMARYRPSVFAGGGKRR